MKEAQDFLALLKKNNEKIDKFFSQVMGSIKT